MNISLSMARALLAGTLSEAQQAEITEKIREANALFVPGNWTTRGDDLYRLWPRGGPQAAIVTPVLGWQVANHSGREVASGPETGPVGCAHADKAIRAWAIAEGWVEVPVPPMVVHLACPWCKYEVTSPVESRAFECNGCRALLMVKTFGGVPVVGHHVPDGGYCQPGGQSHEPT